MDKFFIFLFTLAAHVPLVILESNRTDLNPPETIVVHKFDKSVCF